MALSRTVSTAVSVVAGTAVLVAIAGCNPISYRQLDFTDTEAPTTTVTTVTILPGAGNVVVRGGSTSSVVQVKRKIRYQGAEPTAKHRIEGTELILDTSCGRRCTVSFEVSTPAQVAVRGESNSGDVSLHQVGEVQVKLGSGDITAFSPAGPVWVETGSGDIDVNSTPAAVTLRTGSGTVTGRAIGGTVDAETGSGNVNIDLSAPASTRAHAGSGNVRITVPSAAYRVRSSVGSGEADLQVTNDPAAKLLLDVQTGSGDIVILQR